MTMTLTAALNGTRERKRDLLSCTFISRSWCFTSRRQLCRGIVYSFQRDKVAATRDWPEAGVRSHGRWTTANRTEKKKFGLILRVTHVQYIMSQKVAL